MHQIVIIPGSTNIHWVKTIAQYIGIECSDVCVDKFSNGEISVILRESVRDKDVFIIQSVYGDVNDKFFEILLLIQACEMSSARKIIVVLPIFPYSIQSRSPYERVSTYMFSQLKQKMIDVTGAYDISEFQNLSLFSNAAFIARSLETAGADHIITMELHDPQFQGFFKIPVENIDCVSEILTYIKRNIPDYQQATIVSPDTGGAKRALHFASLLSLPFAIIHKDKNREKNFSDGGGRVSPMCSPPCTSLNLVGDVTGRVAIIIDDIVDTTSTLIKVSEQLHLNGAKKIYAVAIHAIITPESITKINSSKIDKLIVSNSICHDAMLPLSSKLCVYDVASIFAETIRRMHNGESVLALFKNYIPLDVSGDPL